MNFWIVLIISIAVTAWVSLTLWQDFRRGTILSGSICIKRSGNPILYWLAFAVQSALIAGLATATVVLALALARGDLPS